MRSCRYSMAVGEVAMNQSDPMRERDAALDALTVIKVVEEFEGRGDRCRDATATSRAVEMWFLIHESPVRRHSATHGVFFRQTGSKFVIVWPINFPIQGLPSVLGVAACLFAGHRLTGRIFGCNVRFRLHSGLSRGTTSPFAMGSCSSSVAR